MEEDIQNYSPTVMFRGTPCMLHGRSLHFKKRFYPPTLFYSLFFLLLNEKHLFGLNIKIRL